MFLNDENIDFSQYMEETDHKQKIKPAGLWVAELEEELINPPVDRSVPMPWLETQSTFAFRPGEVTVWAGANGGGKSLMTGQVALGLVKRDQRVLIASFEMKPKISIKRMLRQFAGKSLDSENYRVSPEAQKRDAYGRFKIFAGDKLWFYDQQGTVNAKQMAAVCRYAAVEMNMNHIFIDSLMKCVSGEDDYNGQKAFIDELTAIARDHDVHIHLVHHIRKLQSDEARPSKFDLRGSSSITDQVDNVLILWRNKAKEHAIQQNKEIDMSLPDAMLLCEKQRNGDAEEWYSFWYHADSQQFLDKIGSMPMDFDATGDF
jgi:twinkle protein